MGTVPNGGDLEKDAVFEVSMVGPKLWRMREVFVCCWNISGCPNFLCIDVLGVK